MRLTRLILNSYFAAILSIQPVFAQDPEIDMLFKRLSDPAVENWEKIEEQIWENWSRSGSAAMDLLLQRGRAAMEAGDYKLAINHFTALIDHAPEFAEGWNSRATAYFLADRFSLSISDIRETLARNPRHFGALQGLGRILEEFGEKEDALRAYSAAFSIHPRRTGLKESVERLEKLVNGQDI